jgi:hypothetical protein
MARLATTFAATILAGAVALPALAQQPVIAVPGVEPAPAAAPMPAGPIAPSIPDIYAQPKAAEMINATAPDASSPAGQQVTNLLTQVCVPLLRNGAGDMKTIAKTVGLKMYRGAWTLQLDKINQITVQPPTTANPNICRMTIQHTVDAKDPLLNAMAYWASTQNPPLKQLSNGYFTDAGTTRTTTWSWYSDTPSEQYGLAYSEQKINGQPAGKGFDLGNLQLSVTKK